MLVMAHKKNVVLALVLCCVQATPEESIIAEKLRRVPSNEKSDAESSTESHEASTMQSSSATPSSVPPPTAAAQPARPPTSNEPAIEKDQTLGQQQQSSLDKAGKAKQKAKNGKGKSAKDIRLALRNVHGGLVYSALHYQSDVIEFVFSLTMDEPADIAKNLVGNWLFIGTSI